MPIRASDIFANANYICSGKCDILLCNAIYLRRDMPAGMGGFAPVGRGFTPAVYASHEVGLLIHRKRSPFPHKGRLSHLVRICTRTPRTKARPNFRYRQRRQNAYFLRFAKIHSKAKRKLNLCHSNSLAYHQALSCIKSLTAVRDLPSAIRRQIRAVRVSPVILSSGGRSLPW